MAATNPKHVGVEKTHANIGENEDAKRTRVASEKATHKEKEREEDEKEKKGRTKPGRRRTDETMTEPPDQEEGRQGSGRQSCFARRVPPSALHTRQGYKTLAAHSSTQTRQESMQRVDRTPRGSAGPTIHEGVPQEENGHPSRRLRPVGFGKQGHADGGTCTGSSQRCEPQRIHNSRPPEQRRLRGQLLKVTRSTAHCSSDQDDNRTVQNTGKSTKRNGRHHGCNTAQAEVYTQLNTWERKKKHGPTKADGGQNTEKSGPSVRKGRDRQDPIHNTRRQ